MKSRFLLLLGVVLLLAACRGGIGIPNRTGDEPAATTRPLVETAQLVPTIQAAQPAATTRPLVETAQLVPTIQVVQPVATTRPLVETAQLVPTIQAAQPEKPIALPPGFVIVVYAEGLNSPRMLAVGPDGWLYVAERGAGRILRLPDRDGDGRVDEIEVVASGLKSPTSLAFARDGSLYVGETTQVLRLSEPDGQGVFQARQVIVPDLPDGGHVTRTVLFTPDGSRLLVSIGSSCNVCVEADERRAAIMSYAPDGSDGQFYASGLRNAVGMVFRPGTDELWATNNGRDFLGDDLPPETVNLVSQGDHFGWPTCHAGRIVDPDLGSPNSCDQVQRPVVEMQAHSAPLGLTFYTGSQFPESYQGDLFVAFHGSWNRSVPTGYKVVRIPIGEDGTPGEVQDFAVGWLTPDGERWGRPVDVITGSDGSLFISEDGRGFIYRVFYQGLMNSP